MTPEVPLSRRLLALTLMAVLTALIGTIPILDILVGDGGAAVEAQHHPETHGYPHDHLICIQQQANQWVRPCEVQLPKAVAELLLPGIPDKTPSAHSKQLSLPHSRAPPAV